jgi:hypothetical protein
MKPSRPRCRQTLAFVRLFIAARMHWTSRRRAGAGDALIYQVDPPAGARCCFDRADRGGCRRTVAPPATPTNGAVGSARLKATPPLGASCPLSLIRAPPTPRRNGFFGHSRLRRPRHHPAARPGGSIGGGFGGRTDRRQRRCRKFVGGAAGGESNPNGVGGSILVLGIPPASRQPRCERKAGLIR